MKHYERALIDRGARSYGTRSVPTTFNVESTIGGQFSKIDI